MNYELKPYIDSRRIVDSEMSIFFAVKGANVDAHIFIHELYENGVRNFVIEDSNFDTSIYPEGNFELVDSTLISFQDYVSKLREQFNIPVIGITGSNGKTIVKEWLTELLEDSEVVVKSPRSFNSQWGVPLSVAEMRPYHTIGIFEAGISKEGEMDSLEKVIKPTIGIFTNLGSAHDEGFESRNYKLKEKLKLFQDCNAIIYQKDDEVEKELNSYPAQLLSWSMNQDAQINFKKVDEGLEVSSDLFHLKKGIIKTDFADAPSLENLCHCIILMFHIGLSIEEINKRISKVKPVSMRLEVKKGVNNCVLINDVYNNDLAGIEAALEFTRSQVGSRSLTVILSDIPHAEKSLKDTYDRLQKALNANGVERFIGIGKDISKFDFQTNDTFFFSTTAEFLASDVDFENEGILIKGARAFEFEKITRSLSAQQHKTVLEIDLNVIESNFQKYKSILKPTTKVMVMVKAQAYGSGGDDLASTLQKIGADYLAVAYADEGVELRKNGLSIPIMVMNPSAEDFDNLIMYELEPEIYSFKLLNDWVDYNQKENKPFVHLKLDTGMHRLGFEQIDIPKLISVLKNNEVRVKSIFTHLAAADESIHNDFTQNQFDQFDKMSSQLKEALPYPLLLHALNSSGISQFPRYQYDMVRLGIGLYGFNPVENRIGIETAATLHSTISQIKSIKKGETVGYGRKGLAKEQMQVATISIGYADGVSRLLSNGVGSVFINGNKAPIFGNVCMDMLMVDVTGIDCKEGDQVEIFGDNISIAEVARQCQTIPYEVLTSVSYRVKKVYFRD